MAEAGGKESADHRSAWVRGLATTEGHILVSGSVLAIAYLATVGLTRFWSGKLCQDLIAMSTTHVIGGRFAGISTGYALEMAPWLIMVANLAIEAVLVLHFYPLFVLSYKKLIVIEPLKDAMAGAQHYAEAHQARIRAYGIPGLLLFVWFPFWMTGPLVGSVIGFLIGLRPWTNMAVVIAGTGLATVGWGVVLERVHDKLQGLGPYVPFLFVALIVLAAIAIHIRHAFARRAHNNANGPPPDQDDTRS
jgi:uncharacterized membrane protein